MNATPIAAVNSGVAALRSAAKPAGRVTVANAINVNGTAENIAPTIRNPVKRPRTAANVSRPATATSKSAPIARRISAAQTGPTSGAAMRMNKKTAPQTAPRKRSEPKSRIVSGRRDAGAWAVIRRCLGVGLLSCHRRRSSV